MKFQDYAANETALLASRLLAKRSKQSVSDLRAFRQALDEAARALEATLGATTKVEQDGELADVVERLTAAATAQAQAVSQHEKSEAKAAIDAARRDLDAAHKDLDAARNARDEQVRAKATLEGELTQLRGELGQLRQDLQAQAQAKAGVESELAQIRKELQKQTQAKTAVDGELAQLRQELQKLGQVKAAVDGELTQLRQEMHAQGQAKSAVDGELAQLRKEQQKQSQAKAAVDAELTQLRQDMQKQAQAKTAIEADVMQLRKELQKQGHSKAAADAAKAAVDEDLIQLRHELQEHARAKAATDSALKELRAAHAAETASLGRANSELERSRRDLQAELDAKLATETMLRQRVAIAEGDLDRARVEAQATHDAEPPAGAREKQATQLLDRLLGVSQSLGAGTTIDEVLTALVGAIGTDFSRVARFRMKGNRLEGVHQTGFDAKNDISKVAIPLTMDSLVTRAVTSDRVESFASRELAGGVRPPLGGNPDSALALPIKLHGETVAVIYAEDSLQSDDDPAAFGQCAKVAELLRRQAVPILEKLTVEPKVLAELDAYATLLLDEIEHMYTSAASLGKKSAELKTDLKANLQCAREIYAQRVSSQGPAAAAVLDDRLATVLDARAATPFGRDLAAIAGRTNPAPQQKSSRAAAQAS